MNTASNRTSFRFAEPAAVLLIVALAAYLRLHHIADNPGWYTDEGTHLQIAQNLMHGRVQYLAVEGSVLLFARPPLFHLLLAGMMAVFGTSMHTLRTLTALCGVASVLALWGTVRLTARDRMLALLAAFLLAIYPNAVTYTRLGFSYALLGPLVILLLLGLVKYHETHGRGWLALAALTAGFGLTSDIMMGSLLPPLLLIVWATRRRDLLWSLPLLAAPFGLYALVMLIHAGGDFVYDLNVVLFRLNRLSLGQQIDTLTRNYTTLMTTDYWMPLAAIGCFLIRPRRLGMIALLCLLLPIALLGRTVALYSLSYYYVTPLLGLVALGLAGMIRTGTPLVVASARDGLTALLPVTWHHPRILQGIAALIALAIIGTPLLLNLRDTVRAIDTRLPTPIDGFLENPDDARRVIDYINAQTQPDDLVVASVTLAWALDARTADYVLGLVYDGVDVPHLPGDVDRDRFAYDPRYTAARYVVVDDLWRTWGVAAIPPTEAILREVETWPLVFESGRIRVYENPDRAGATP
jgi:4-amino-4-deoxy-L-arabinose transferase-like glycosyltransferase